LETETEKNWRFGFY
jgi:hypothetical protein